MSDEFALSVRSLLNLVVISENCRHCVSDLLSSSTYYWILSLRLADLLSSLYSDSIINGQMLSLVDVFISVSKVYKVIVIMFSINFSAVFIPYSIRLTKGKNLLILVSYISSAALDQINAICFTSCSVKDGGKGLGNRFLVTLVAIYQISSNVWILGGKHSVTQFYIKALISSIDSCFGIVD